jgi:hypothetical protein
MKALETEVEQRVQERELATNELEASRADYDVLVRSREALKAEVLELRQQLK